MVDEEELTPEAIAELKTKATKAEELEKAMVEKDAKIKEFETDEGLINWRKSRKQIKAMDEALNKKGLRLDEETDEVKSLEKEFSAEDIDQRARVIAEQYDIEKSLTKAQRDLSDEDRATFAKFYEKAAYGEVVTSGNIEEIIEQTWRMAGIGTGTKGDAERSAGTRGGAPRLAEPSKDFADSNAGKDVLSKMGLPTEAKKK